MPELDRNHLWSEFLSAWPPSRVRQMTLDEYTNPNKEDAFIYWIEKRLEKLGSILGGSAFKFGIYCRDKVEVKEASGGRIWGEKYAWLSKFGGTEQAAFATIRTRLVEVVDAAEASNFARIEEIDLSPTLKWKVAFLYQDRKSPNLFPIFRKEALFQNYLSIDPRAKLGSTPYHVMYETLMERHSELGDVFEISRALWEKYKDSQNRSAKAWAVPLSWTLQDPESIEILCSKTRVEPEDIDPRLDNLLTKADLSEGDQLALLAEGDVRALGTLSSIEPDQLSWDQEPVNFPSPLLVNPTSEVKEINATERNEIWKHSSKGHSVAATAPTQVEPPPPPCQPQNIILYGPPGTGKTYSTVRRALQLVLGADKLEGLSDKALLTLFRDHQARGQIEFVTFHQAYGYEEFVEGLRPVIGDNDSKDVHYELHDGIFKRIALRAAAEGLGLHKDSLVDEAARVRDALNKPTSGRATFNFSAQNRQYVLIIDEINRGNISKILGELITLLDADKRLGASNELKLPLSYSPTYRFAVPPNLHVVGTMNTADRSIALMDVALRRRFTFEELMPNAEVIREQLSKTVTKPALIDLVVDVFNTINNRIRFFYDRDHQLGHSYFLNVDSMESLRLVFVNRVLPLLQEYFYGSWNKICIVLGCPYDDSGTPTRSSNHILATAKNTYLAPIIEARSFEELNALGFEHDVYEDRVDFSVRPSFHSGQMMGDELVRTFLNILESHPDDLQLRFKALCKEEADQREVAG